MIMRSESGHVDECKAPDIPVLILAFNRPRHLERLLLTLEPQSPETLYVHIDGPRQQIKHEVNVVKSNLSVLERIVTWPCRLRVLQQEHNLGCARGVHTGVSWLFDHEEVGLILEDDLAVSTDLLAQARLAVPSLEGHPNLGSLSFFNYVPRKYINEPEASFYLSKYSRSIAWVTWRTKWEGFRLFPEEWTSDYLDFLLHQHGSSRFAAYWKRLYLDRVRPGLLDTWDVSWAIWQWSRDLLTAVAVRNMAQHLGFDSEATHAKSQFVPDWHPDEIVTGIERWNNPRGRKADARADRWTESSYYPITRLAELRARLAGSGML